MTSVTSGVAVNVLFRACSDPVRLRILGLLRNGELCVCDLVAVLKLPQPTISRHLSYLRRARLVTVREERSWNFYRLAIARSAFHRRLFACLASCLPLVPEMAADAGRADRLRTRGGCCPP